MLDNVYAKLGGHISAQIDYVIGLQANDNCASFVENTVCKLPWHHLQDWLHVP